MSLAVLSDYMAERTRNSRSTARSAENGFDLSIGKDKKFSVSGPVVIALLVVAGGFFALLFQHLGVFGTNPLVTAIDRQTQAINVQAQAIDQLRVEIKSIKQETASLIDNNMTVMRALCYPLPSR